MDSNQAQKLMPVHLDLSTFVTAILANTDITDKIGDRLTMNPPNEGETPYLFFTASEPTQKKTDDIQSIWFRHFLTWKLDAPSSWTQTEMREFMELVMFELQKFQGTIVSAKTLGNVVNANLYLVDCSFQVYFPDDNQKGYQSMIYNVDMEWK